MKTLALWTHNLGADESGATLIEYCVLLGLIAIVCIAVVKVIGQYAFQFLHVPGWN